MSGGVDAELRLTLLLSLDLLGDLLFLSSLLHDGLVFLEVVGAPPGSICVLLEQTGIHQVVDLGIKVFLRLVVTLQNVDLLLHGVILSDLGVNLQLLDSFSLLLLLDLLRGPSSFSLWLEHVVGGTLAGANSLTCLEDLVGLGVHVDVLVALVLNLLMPFVDLPVHPVPERRADECVDDVDDVLPRHL